MYSNFKAIMYYLLTIFSHGEINRSLQRFVNREQHSILPLCHTQQQRIAQTRTEEEEVLFYHTHLRN